jgi:hypothetical protein
MSALVLHDFLVANRREVLERSRARLIRREAPTPAESEVAQGLPLFLDQLIAVLGTEQEARGPGHRGISASAAIHGGELSRMGLTVGQVVQDYGSLCQSVTELADERDLAITAKEFHQTPFCTAA